MILIRSDVIFQEICRRIQQLQKCTHIWLLAKKNYELSKPRKYCMLLNVPSLLELFCTTTIKGSEVMLLTPDFGMCSAADTIAAKSVTGASPYCHRSPRTTWRRALQDAKQYWEGKGGNLDLGAGLVADYWTLCLDKLLRVKHSWKLQRLQMKTKDSIM